MATQYSCLENHMDRRAWWAAVYGVAKSQTKCALTAHTDLRPGAHWPVSDADCFLGVTGGQGRLLEQRKRLFSFLSRLPVL